jgi:RNase P subunit RPR2
MSSAAPPSSNRHSRPQGWRRFDRPPVLNIARFRVSELQKNRDALARMNFLYQSAHYYSHYQPINSSSSHSSLARFYVSTLKKISTRLVLRLDSSIKNSICKVCNNVLVTGAVNQQDEKENEHKATCSLVYDEFSPSLVRLSCLSCGHLNPQNINRPIREAAIKNFQKERKKRRKKKKEAEKQQNKEIQSQSQSHSQEAAESRGEQENEESEQTLEIVSSNCS